MQSRISFRSRSDLVLNAEHTLDFYPYLVLQACTSFCSVSHTITFFRAPDKNKGFSFFFLWGNPVQNCPQNPAPASHLFSTRKSNLRSQKEGLLGKKIAWGRVGGQGEKGKKDAQNKVGTKVLHSCFCLVCIKMPLLMCRWQGVGLPEPLTSSPDLHRLPRLPLNQEVTMFSKGCFAEWCVQSGQWETHFLPLLVLTCPGAAPVKSSTGKTKIIENTREFPEIISSTGAKFW